MEMCPWAGFTVHQSLLRFFDFLTAMKHLRVSDSVQDASQFFTWKMSPIKQLLGHVITCTHEHQYNSGFFAVYIGWGCQKLVTG